MSRASKVLARVVQLPFRLLYRTVRVLLTVGMVGFGNGFGGLGRTLRKVKNPEKENPIVQVERQR